MPTVSGTVTDASGNTAAWSASWTVQAAQTVNEVADFTKPPAPPSSIPDTVSSGFWLPGGVDASGVDVSIHRLQAMTSTKGAIVAGIPAGSTNPYRVMKVGSTNSGTPTVGLVVADLTIQGTPQGHNYGGLDILYATNPNIHDIKVTGIPGSASGPPGETFSIHTQRTNNPTFSDVVLDGRDATGTPVAATLNGNSYLPNGGTWTRVQHLYAAAGFGTAIFQASGTQPYTWNDCTWIGCRKAFNLEDSLVPGPYVFNRPTFGPTTGTGQGEVMQVSSKTSSAQVRINDPILTGGLTWPLKIRWYPNSGTPQQGSDIKLFIGGVDKTNDPTKLQLVNY